MMIEKIEYYRVEVQTIAETVWHVWATKDTLDGTEKVIKSLKSIHAKTHAIKDIRVMKITEYKEQIL